MINFKSLQLSLLSFLFSGLFLFMGLGNANAQDIAKGEELFKANCTACHALDKKVIGPALRGVSEQREEDWLISWIKNSSALIKSGDADAIAIFEEYNGSPMTSFPNLSDEDIKSILLYTTEAPVAAAKKDTAQLDAGATTTASSDNSLLYIIAFLVVVVVFYAALKSKNAVKAATGEQPESVYQQVRTWLKANPGVSVTIIVVLFILGVKDTWEVGFDAIGVAQNYQPEQPINFSHKIHAGDQKIDCNYCHSSARHSKTSGIPSANVCMNCHTYINEGPTTGTAEIAKIYEAVGFDPETRTYVDSLKKGPIEWVKVHNLPDLVYFSHAQHVTAGKQDCQTCHGPIEEMDVVKQESKLTMGWCIECHRETEVNTDNPYYKELNKNWAEKFHGEKITVDKIGGLECGKCHY
ncbi:MAG: cytochrome c3 family protein [Flavobacteriales bacterium]